MSLADRYAEIQQRIADAARTAGRAASDVTLVAVSKRQPPELVIELAAMGHRDFGENQVQAWRSRLELDELASIQWHLIGPVQTNKVKFIARTPPACLHTVDRPVLIEALGGRLSPEACLDVLIQVNIDREPQKSGCLPEGLDALADAACSTPGLKLRGLMAIPRPPQGAPPAQAFERMRSLLESIADRIEGPSTLSMGMSGDFETAIAHGSTVVRVGTALFGARSV